MIGAAQLDDEPGKLYAVGVPRNMQEYDIEDLHGAFDRHFTHAEVVVITLPIEGSVSIEEVDPADLFENLDGGA